MKDFLPAYIAISDEGDELLVKRFDSEEAAIAYAQKVREDSRGCVGAVVMPSRVAMAAPDLLKACLASMALIKGSPNAQHASEVSLALAEAIAKATGFWHDPDPAPATPKTPEPVPPQPGTEVLVELKPVGADPEWDAFDSRSAVRQACRAALPLLKSDRDTLFRCEEIGGKVPEKGARDLLDRYDYAIRLLSQALRYASVL